MTTLQLMQRGLVLIFILSAASCGGSSSDVPSPGPTPTPPTPTSNVVSVVVDGGPAAAPAGVNTLFTTVTVCVPGSTSQCQTIDHIQVDTGSYGLRILGSVLTQSLPVTHTSAGNTLLECAQFVDGYSWGPVYLADVKIAGESASSLPIQVIGGSGFAVPTECSGTGMEEDTVATFGANGILGIGVFEQDCGTFCTTTTNGLAPTGHYYACSTPTLCSAATVPLNSQVLNPVANFATDNNGTFIELPTVAAAGAATVSGSLIFGIDTQTNNVSGTQTVLSVDSLNGDFTTTYNSMSLAESFIDSGSNAIYFTDTTIATCMNPDYAGFYCPANTLNLSAVLQGSNAASSANVTFSVSNAETLGTNNPTFTAQPALAGTFSSAISFDWGLPFFYGRHVATALEGHTTAVGTGPYVAF